MQGMNIFGDVNLGDLDLNNIVIKPYINNYKNLLFLSLYFSKCPCFLNYLSFQEVIELLKTSVIFDIKNQIKLFHNVENLCDKIKNNESIIDEKESLRDIQILVLQTVASSLNLSNSDINNFINYQIINFFRDIDFCLKFCSLAIVGNLNCTKHNFSDELELCLIASEYRYGLFNAYTNRINKENKFTEEEQKKIYETLTIKDFIIIGDEHFHNKIKNIEKNIKVNSLNYLNMEQLSQFLDGNRPKPGKKLAQFF